VVFATFNWIPVGKTRSWSRHGSDYQFHGQTKAVFICPLRLDSVRRLSTSRKETVAYEEQMREAVQLRLKFTQTRPRVTDMAPARLYCGPASAWSCTAARPIKSNCPWGSPKVRSINRIYLGRIADRQRVDTPVDPSAALMTTSTSMSFRY
jgi:hypothetical protein